MSALPVVFSNASSSRPLAPAEGYWMRAWRRLLRNRLAAAALVLAGGLILIAALAPLVATHDPSAQDLNATFRPPSWQHLMGTDNLGRDWYSRLVYGARVSLAVALFAQAIVLVIALPIGLVAGYSGKNVDALLMRFTDLVYAFPALLLVILLRGVLGGSVFTLFLVIGAVNWMDMTRLVRGQVLSSREREFVGAARSLGAGDRDIIVRHILPNISSPLIVLVAFGIPRAIFIEASLSFIGIGVDPGTPSWGSMVQEGYLTIYAYPHLVLFPAAAIALLMLAFTFLGDGLRDALDPRSEVAPPRDDSQLRPPPASISGPEEVRKAA